MPLPKVLQNSLRLPVIGSPLFIVSGPELVIAQCKAGIVGSFPALNARPEPVLEEWIVRIKTELAQWEEETGNKAAPFAVNQICHSSNDRLPHDIEVCKRQEVPIIITSLRAPKEVVEATHSYGGVVFHDIINIRHAKKAVDEGVDGLIPVCAGAGGHAGVMSPFALVAELRKFWNGVIALSGSIANGRSILAAQALGADLAYMGTRFIATREANAPEAYKAALVEAASGGDIVYTNLFTGVHGNYLKSSIAAAGLNPDDLPASDKSKMNFGSGGNMKQKAWRDIWGAGQGVGQIADAPTVEELVSRLEAEYHEAKQALAA
ncbi:MAG TPA: nitronate monooxygenase family protein [Rhizomicrobium sp.]|jgi:nitronate monooxygenase|nr:nitronate monooxygenase family protein [Rhizomicrobium sp.]